MRTTARAIVVALLALLGAILLGLSVTISTSVQLMASYALKGTQIPVFNITSDQAIQNEAILYGVGTIGSPPTVVVYPASLRPFSPGFLSDPSWNQSVAAGVGALQGATANDPNPVIYGYSQGAIVGSEYKKAFNANPIPGVTPTYVFTGNGNRPNGGVLSRFEGVYVPGLDLTATSPTPTTSPGWQEGDPPTTTDIAGQYDPIADFPTNPLNPFALANAGMGILVHLNYANADPSTAVLQDEYGDTAYYLIPTYPVPLLMPVQLIPVVGPIAADMLDPLVRMMVEAGYDRTISPGQPTTANFGYFPNPIAFAGNIPVAIMTGLDNGLEDIGLGRALQTDRPEIGPGTSGQDAYGIGGPPVTMNPTTNDQLTTLSVASGPSNNPNGQVAQVNTPPQQPPTTETNSNGANRFNVLRLSLSATPGQSGADATKPSQPKLANSPGSALSGVRDSIKGVRDAIKSVTDSIKSGTDSDTAADAAPAS